MPQRALRHTATGYVVHVTTDPTLAAPAGHDYVAIADPGVSPPAPPWVVNAGALASASQAVIDAYNATQPGAIRAAILAALETACTDLEGSTSQQLLAHAKSLATALKAFARGT